VPLLESGLAEVCAAIVADQFRPEDVRWAEGRTYGVVLAADGYPEAPRVGDRVDGLERVPEGVNVFHAGTRLQDGHVVTAGGRVLTLVGADREAVYQAAGAIRFDGKQLRRDIGIEIPSAVAANR
jgi:phosphoribosylamine--glycine ligase